jgi:hypothetical protein
MMIHFGNTMSQSISVPVILSADEERKRENSQFDRLSTIIDETIHKMRILWMKIPDVIAVDWNAGLIVICQEKGTQTQIENSSEFRVAEYPLRNWNQKMGWVKSYASVMARKNQEESNVFSVSSSMLGPSIEIVSKETIQIRKCDRTALPLLIFEVFL